MLTIRKEQMRAFSRAVERNLECAIFNHLGKVWREDCDRMGEPAVRALIRKGLREAAGYGIEGDYELLRYVDLMFLVAGDLGPSGRFPWAGAILRDSALAPAAKLDRLYERARQELGAGRPPEADRAGPQAGQGKML